MPYVLGDGSDAAPSKAVWQNPVKVSSSYLLGLLNILYLFIISLVSVGFDGGPSHEYSN